MASSHSRWSNPRAFRGQGFSYPSRGGRGTFQRNQHLQPTTTVGSPPPRLGSLLSNITVEDIGDDTGTSQDGPVTIEHCHYIASYNWLDAKSPTILVPVESVKLKEDSGDFYRDPNAARYPKHPMDPAVEAILAIEPDFPTSQVDILACSSTLGNLFRFVQGENKAFRMLVHVVGETMFFIRRENSPTQLIPDVKGYGHTFPESYTMWAPDVKNSASHQRIIRYDLDGLDCLVRYEADGYLRHLAKEGATEPGTEDLKSSADDLHDLLASALPSKEPIAAGPSKSKDLAISHRGDVIPQAAIFDLKTRSAYKVTEDTLGGELPRLWIGQIPNFILARHKSGVFNDIKVSEVRRQVDDWELRQQDVIRKFVALLRKIIASAKERSDGQLELLRQPDSNMLEMRQQAAGVNIAVSDRLFVRWSQGGTSDVDAESDHSDPYVNSGSGLYYDDEQADNEDGSDEDFTACSAESCGYCGHCKY